jgi:hypothetical protein
MTSLSNIKHRQETAPTATINPVAGPAIDLFSEKGLGAFWARGSLSAMDQVCLASFVRRGYQVTLYSYEPINGVPPGVTVADAATIVPESMIERVRYNGKPDLAHFSDLFRYSMIEKSDQIWIDVDVMLLADLAVPRHENIIVTEEQGGINGAVLYLSDQRLKTFIQSAMLTKLDRNLLWGETGPLMIEQAVKSCRGAVDLYDHHHFYPIEHYDIWKIFLPEEYDECVRKCDGATTLHIFNNILSTMGIWKDLAPPEGSYLHAKIAELGMLDCFRDIYPEKIMRACLRNFRLSKSGKGLGVGTLVRELIPSIGRTYEHYRK